MPEIVQAFIVFLIVQGLKGLGRVLGFDLSGVAAVAAAIVVAGLVASYQMILSVLPPEWVAVAQAFMNLVAAVLVASGFHYTLSSFRR